MDRSRITPRLFGLISATLALLGTVLRSVCMLVSFDAAVGYFNQGLFPVLSDALYFLTVIVTITLVLLMPKDTLPTVLYDHGRPPVAHLLGLILAAFTIGVLTTCYQDRTGNFLTFPMVLGIFSSLYFFVTGRKSGRFTDQASLLGFIPVIWCVTAAWETYTDQFTTMNSPVKIGLQMGFLGLAFILVAELRFRLGKALPRLAAALMGIGLFFTLNGSIPVLVGTGAGVLDNTLHFLYASVILCGGIYGAILLLRSLCTTREPSSEPPDVEVDVADDTPTAPSTDSPNAE